MSNYSQVFDGLETVLEAGISGLKVYKHPPDSISHSPAIILVPDSFDPERAFAGNSFEGNVRMIYLLSSADPASGWAQLYDAIDPTTGSKSVIKAIRDNAGIDGKVDSAGVTMVENIGKREYAGGNYFGADFVLTFYKSVA